MSFSLASLRSDYFSILTHGDRGFLVSDAVLAVGLAALGGLLLTGTLNFGPLSGVTQGLAWGCAGTSMAIVLSNGSTLLMKWVRSNGEKREILNRWNAFQSRGAGYLGEMTSIAGTTPTDQDVRAAKKSDCHQIFHNLYLGSDTAFVQATHLTIRTTNEKLQPIYLDTTNSHQFTAIITLCPLKDMFGDYDDLQPYTPDEIANEFENHHIEWMHVGKAIGDQDVYWPSLIHDCTFPYSNLATVHIAEGMEKQALEDLCNQKKEIVDQTSVSNWFEPIFREIDGSIFGFKKILVHCRGGVSRSATLLAAYLINRFQLTPEQAIAFLISKRACVDSKFLPQLKAYAASLQAEKANLRG